MIFSIELTIDESWITSKYNHVHHGRSLFLLEDCRLELLRSIGTPNDQLLKAGLALVITNISVDYKREIREGRVTITCHSGLLTGREIVLKQEIINERGKIAVQASVTSMFMSVETRRGLDIPEDFGEKFEAWAKKD